MSTKYGASPRGLRPEINRFVTTPSNERARDMKRRFSVLWRQVHELALRRPLFSWLLNVDETHFPVARWFVYNHGDGTVLCDCESDFIAILIKMPDTTTRNRVAFARHYVESIADFHAHVFVFGV